MGKFQKLPKKGLSDARKKHTPQKSLNPFEIHVNRSKFKVLGRQSKTDRGLPGVARAKALKKRKATLLQEFKLKDKSNKFLDRRIGERNSTMTAEDKMTARFAAERMRAQTRKAMFNLADDETLTHKGQTLNEIEKFDDPRSDDEDDDGDNPLQNKGNLKADFVSDAHFGGGLLSRSHEDKAKSRKDLIDQLIAESKKKKAEQQKLREQTLDLTEKLDTEWKDLLPVMNAGPKASDVEKPKLDSFDTLMRELKFEARGKPSDRLKSEDEVAREEKEKLEELEAARMRRMQGIIDSSNAVPNHRSADDLDDGFAMDSEDEDGKEEEDKMEQDTSNESESEEESVNDSYSGNDKKNEPKETSEEDSEESDDEDNIDDLKYDSSDEESVTEHQDYKELVKKNEMDSENSAAFMQTAKKSSAASIVNKDDPNQILAIREDLKKRKELMDAARKELPYTFDAPGSYEELQIALAGRSPEHQGVIVERIIKCTHPSLAIGNKEKLSNLFTLLMQHLHDAGAVEKNENVCWAILDRLAPSLYDIAQWCPSDTGECMRHILQEKQNEYRRSRKKFPGVETLVSLLFPTSDFRHPVVTPTLVFMGQILSSCTITSRHDVARGLLIVSLILEYTTLSKRFSPESINFLRNVLYLATNLPSSKETLKDSKRLKIPTRPLPPLKMRNTLCFSLQPLSDDKVSCMLVCPGFLRNHQFDDRLKASDLIGSDSVDDVFCMTSLYISVRILSAFVTQLASQPACRHIFSPFPPLLEMLLEENWIFPLVKKEIENLQEQILAVSKTSLKYLVAALKRPKMLKLYEPSIQQVYADGKRNRPISKEQQEKQKLLHRYKRERKGALRELRKDRDFLAKIRIKQQLKSDAERRAKVKEIYGEASVQQGEMKKLARAKKK